VHFYEFRRSGQGLLALGLAGRWSRFHRRPHVPRTTQSRILDEADQVNAVRGQPR
jgi:hypothetical protein